MRKEILLVLLSIVPLFVLGCMPRSDTDASASVHASIPSLLIQYDEGGKATMFYAPLSESTLPFGIDLPALSLTPEMISMFRDAGIEIIHIANQPGGLRFFINGEPYPTLLWDQTTRTGLVNALNDLGVESGPLVGYIELLPEVAFGLTLKMPGIDDDLSVEYTAPILKKDEADAILAKARSVTYNRAIALTYDEEGLASGQLLPGVGITPDAFSLSSAAIVGIQEQGIEQLHVALTESSLIVQINEHELPHVALDREEVARFARLYDELNGCSEICPMDVLFMYLGLYLENLAIPLDFELEFPS